MIYWNNLTGEENVYGDAIALGFQSPEYHNVVSAKILIERANNLYKQLIMVKEGYEKNLEREEKLENINLTSERVSRIQKRIRGIA